MRVKKIDIIGSIITGEITAWYFIGLFGELTGKIKILSLILWSLPIVFPILSVFCLWLAFLIGKKFLFVFQFAKFLLIGVLATIFDLGTLDIFITVSGIASGITYSVFKGTSFIISTSAKYFADKFWAFEKKETTEMGKEFSKFFLVTIIGLGINVLTASFVVNQIGPQFGISAKSWANIGGIVAVLPTFLWNFFSYKFLVFKK